ncbi:type I-E CRISPR-associated protein Cse2/CasB [Xylocopilactobacillus apicola]|uniref:Type I-E CRISPR-associated protein Cse2/CasB n=1 Tax=Xylocopilactobacillus apicola TaxID=2932184 RepID=A0AAU9D9E3_9LACO|nr:type I-E CRISPR-associated protein Cse2/CasB [Xylocopilactobacillus apicola]BDR58970.1 type I-E CRISPR-associated protein Cse2/CasB [Xylocopilactobacillus apicola]
MKQSEIKNVTGSIIHILHGTASYRGVLASIRGAASFNSPRAQPAWPIIMRALREDLLGRNGQPSYAEKAVYSALRMYAIHQQGSDEFVYGPIDYKKESNSDSESDDKLEPGVDLFTVLGELRHNEDLEVALDRRVRQTLSTTDVNSVINSLNHLVGIIKSKKLKIKIDYGKLAQDLYWFQMSYESANSVRLSWGQQYYGNAAKKAEEKGEKND